MATRRTEAEIQAIGDRDDGLITISAFSRKYGVWIPTVSSAVFRYDLKDSGLKFRQAKLYDENAMVLCFTRYLRDESNAYFRKSVSLEEEAQQVEKIYLEKGTT